MFAYTYTKDGLLRVSYQHKVIKVYKTEKAEKLYSQLHYCDDEQEVQLILAKATGNFKRGNEKIAKPRS